MRAPSSSIYDPTARRGGPSGGRERVVVHRSRSRFGAILPVVCLLASLVLTGCEVKTIKLQLPTFFSAGVTEVWFWRLDDLSDQYVRSGHLRITGLTGPPGRKVLHYTMVGPDGS